MPWQARVVDVMAQANAVGMNEHAAAATGGKQPSEKELRQWWEEMESGEKDGLGESPEEAHNTRVSTGSYGSALEHVDGPWMRGSRHATEDLSTVFDSLGDGSMDEDDLVDPMEAESMKDDHVGRADMMHMMDDDDDDDDLLSADGLSDDFEQLAEEGLLDDGPQDDAHEGDDLADELLCMPKAHMAPDDDLKDEHLCMPTSLGKSAVEAKPAAASSGPRNVFGFKDKSPERSRGMSPGRSVLDGRLMDSSPETSLPIGGVRSVLDRSPERSRDLVGPMDGTSIFMDSKVEVPVATPVPTVETTGTVLRAETQGSVLRAETEKQAGGRALDEGQTVLDPVSTPVASDSPVLSMTPDSELKVESAIAGDAMSSVTEKGEEAAVQLPGSYQEVTSATATSADEPASVTGEDRKDAPADAAESAEHVTGVDDVAVGKDSEAGDANAENEGESDATQEVEGAQGEQPAGEKAGDSDSDAKKATPRSTPPSSPSSATAAASTSFPGSVVSPRAALLLDGMPSQQELWSVHQFTNSVGGKLPSVKTIAAAAVLHDLPSAFVKLLDALVLDTVGALLMRPLVYPGMPLNQLAEEEDDDDDVDAEAWVNYDWDAVWEDEDEDDLDLRMAAMLHSKRQQQARASRSGERESSRSSRGGERESSSRSSRGGERESSSRSSRHRDRDRERDRDRRDGRERHSSRDPDRERDKERRDRDRDRERRDRDRERSERGEKDKERTRDKDSGREHERERERDGERRRERSSREREEQRARERELPEWNSNCKIDPKEKEREDRRRAREPEERRVRSERRDREGEERGESHRRERSDRGDREGKEAEEKGESRRRERADRGDRDGKDSSESRRRAREAAAEGEEIAEGQGGAMQDSRREGTERTSSRSSSSRRANEDGEQRRRSSRRSEREAEEAGGRSSRQEQNEDEPARKSSSTAGERERRKGSTSAPPDEARRSSRAGERGESTSSSRRSAQESLSAAVDLRAGTRSRRSHDRSDDKDLKRESSRHSSRNADSATTVKDDSAVAPKDDSASRTSSSRRSASSRSSAAASGGKTTSKVEPKQEAGVVAEPDTAVVLVDVPAEVVVDAGAVETTPAVDEVPQAPEAPQAVSESPIDPTRTEAAAAAAAVPQDATTSTRAVDVEVAVVGAAAAGVAAVGVAAGLQAKEEGLEKKHAEKERESAAKKERKSRKEGKEKREKSKEDTRALEWQDQDPSVALQPENPADSVLPDLFKALADTTPVPPPTDLGTVLQKQAGVQAPAAAESLRSPDSSNPSTPQTTTYTTSYLAPQEQLPLLFPPTNTFEMSTPRDKEIAQDVPPEPTPTPAHPRASSLAEADFELLTAQAVYAPVPDGVLPEPIAHQPTPTVQNVNESSDTLDLNLHLTSTVALSPVPIPKSQLSLANDGFPSPELFSPSVTSPEPSFHEFSSPEIELVSPGLESDQSNTHTLSPQPDSPSDPKVQLFTDARPHLHSDASSKGAFSDSRPQLHSDASSRGAFSEVRPQLYSDASSRGVLSDDSHPMSDDGALADESALETGVSDSHLMTTGIGINTVPTHTQPALSTRSTADSDSDSAGSPKARKPTSHTSRTSTINSFTDEDSDGEYPSNASSRNHITTPKGNTPPAIHSAPVPTLRVLPSNPSPDVTPVPIPKLAIQSAPSPAPQPPNKLKNLLRSITGRAPKSSTSLKWQEPATPQSSPQRNLKVLQEEQVQRWNHSFHAQVGPADLPELSVTTRTLSGSSQHGGVPIPRSPSVKASTSAPWKKAFDDASPRGSLTPQGDAAASSTAGSSFTGRSATAGPTGYQGYDPDSPMSGTSTPPIMRRESGNTASSNPDFWAGADYSRDGGRSDHLPQPAAERPLSPSGIMEVQQMKKSKGLSKAVYKMVGWVKKGKK